MVDLEMPFFKMVKQETAIVLPLPAIWTLPEVSALLQQFNCLETAMDNWGLPGTSTRMAFLEDEAHKPTDQEQEAIKRVEMTDVEAVSLASELALLLSVNNKLPFIFLSSIYWAIKHFRQDRLSS